MAYGVKWDASTQKKCIATAEQRALWPGIVWGLGFVYRFEDVSYSYCVDPDAEIYSSYLQVEIEAYAIQRKTSCGVWIVNRAGGKRFINMQANKRYALLTVEDAIASFKARKLKQISIYRHKILKAETAIELLGEEYQ